MENPCDEGEGDCDTDSQCAGDLKCGNDNCQEFTEGAGATSDCCYEEKAIKGSRFATYIASGLW